MSVKSVVVIASPDGPTGTHETVNIFPAFTGATGEYPTWQLVPDGGPTGTFKHVISGGPTAGRKNVIIGGYTGA